jgi:hypothetical protein
MDHYYQRVEGWFNFPDMYAYAVANAPEKGKFVEVGPWKGQSSSFLAVEIINSGKDITLDCIDNFTGSPIEPGQMYDHDNQAGRLFEVFTRNMKPIEDARPGMVKGIKGDSAESAALYEDESLDFVFIDASHDYESFRKDLLAWHPKVKIGGLLAGHDFADPYPGIMKAVRDHCSHEKVGVTPSTCWFFNKTAKNLTNI